MGEIWIVNNFLLLCSVKCWCLLVVSYVVLLVFNGGRLVLLLNCVCLDNRWIV